MANNAYKNAQTSFLDEIIVDNFAGGGGASTGIELATGRPVNIAINHDAAAILLHKTNHPHTEHIQASVWDVDPEELCAGRPVGLAWFSPDCKHFSKAKGAALVDRNIRGLAWIVLRWAGTVRPRVTSPNANTHGQAIIPLPNYFSLTTGRAIKSIPRKSQSPCTSGFSKTMQSRGLRFWTRIWATDPHELPPMMPVLILWGMKSARTISINRNSGFKTISPRRAYLLV